MRRTVWRGTPWQYTGHDRGFVAYLKSARQRPGFLTAVIAALCFAVGGFKTLGLRRGVVVYVSGLLVIMTIGYVVWRRGARR